MKFLLLALSLSMGTAAVIQTASWMNEATELMLSQTADASA